MMYAVLGLVFLSGVIRPAAANSLRARVSPALLEQFQAPSVFSAQLNNPAYFFDEVLSEQVPQSVQWALLVDGRDAEKGPHAYDDHGFAESVNNSLSFVFEDANSKHHLSWDLFSQIHELCCKHVNYRHTPKLQDGLPGCYHELSCSERSKRVEDVDPELIAIDTNDSACITAVGPYKVSSGHDVEVKLKKLVDEYGRASQAIVAQHGSGDAKLDLLARFLRSFAWSHPFTDYNGRTRTLLLQRELRYLGIAPGCAMMYNNNRDLFVIDLATYKDKLQEGLRMCAEAIKTEQNPWIHESARKLHLEHYAQATPECLEGGNWGSVTLRKTMRSLIE